MADNKTDYTKARMDLIKLLPEPLQSDVNLSLFDNVFNRYLTKQEIEKVAGYIGRGNPSAVRSRRIHEQDVHRQAYQLQPIPYNKIGSIEHMTSWKDMQNELTRLGVDVDRFDEWGTTETFNWVPPIDINKIINYRDYYWVDTDNPDSIPQYITIRSTCATATARYNFWNDLVEQYGLTFAIDELLPSDDTPATFSITEFTAAPDSIKVAGDVTEDILFSDYIDIVGSTNNNGTYHVAADPVYDGVTNQTTIVVDSAIVAAGSPTETAVVALRRFDKIVLPQNTQLVGSPPVAVTDSGDYTSLFVEGFSFFIRNSTNQDLNSAFVETVSSSYDSNTKETTVVISYRVTDDTADGEISLEEQLSVYEADMKCQCNEFGGWDVSQWDDNPREPLWGDDEDASGNPVSDGISDHENLITRISNAVPPTSGVGTDGELWYDTAANILYQNKFIPSVETVTTLATVGSPASTIFYLPNTIANGSTVTATLVSSSPPVPVNIVYTADGTSTTVEVTDPLTIGDEIEISYETATWAVIWRNFSLILEQTTGVSLWDMSLSCDTRPRIDATQQWISQNKWLHKNDVDNFASVTRASQPIIEYDWDLELNEWTYVNYNWSYRSEDDVPFEEVTTSPARIELEPLTWWEHGLTINETITLDDRYGDLTDYFVEGTEVFFVAEFSILSYTVVSSVYKSTGNYPYRTYVTFDKVAPQYGSPTIQTNLVSNSPNPYSIIPSVTTAGDIWEGYGIHWLFRSADDSLPAPHQPINPFMEIDETLTPIEAYGAGSPAILDYSLGGSPVGSPVANTLLFEYTTSLYAQNYLLSQPLSEFILLPNVPSVSTRSLDRMALYGFDDIRVYVADAAGENSVRQFGSYDEIGEVVFDILDVDIINNELIIGDPTLINYDAEVNFQTGETIYIAGNTGTAPIEVEVGTYPTSAAYNRIPINPTWDLDALGVTATGNVSNITNPIEADGFANSDNITIYVRGIGFFQEQPAGANVQIILGESAVDEIGSGIVKVRAIENDATYSSAGDTAISRTTYRIVEQVKTKTNQYPLFDIFTVDGQPAYRTNSIFGYRTSPDAEINHSVGLRIVHDTDTGVYEFDQFLLDEDNGELFAYRDYANKEGDYWYNKETQELKFWDGVYWNDKTSMSEFYRRAIVSPVEPTDAEQAIDGLYWYNTITDTLYRHFGTAPQSWIEVTDVDHKITDINLQTIWRGGKNDDVYIPAQVDWYRRSEEEYNDERSDFVESRTEELLAGDPSLTEPEAIVIATAEWYESQANHNSEDGTWVGDWEIPDPLYYNHLHENRKYLDTRELITHFKSIINEQPAVPGWNGTKEGQFNIVHLNEINYGLGGTIKEFNNGFDTLISSVMVNNVTPISLIEFAHDQYEGLLNTIKELYRENSVEVFADVSTEAILDISPIMADAIIDLYELNDNTAYLYGDSTTFTDNEGINDVGVRNWIATLPYLNLIGASLPIRNVDGDLGLNEVVHHDTHRNTYEVTDATESILSQTIINIPDPRFPSESLGVQSLSSPANNVTEFLGEFSAISSREGVYWYHVGTSPNLLYRYVVAESGTSEPSDTLPDGTLWMDLTPAVETLRIKQTDILGVSSWEVVDGLTIGDGRLHNGSDPADVTTATISAWQVIDLNVILGDVIFELENRLYDNVPATTSLSYDFEETKSANPALWVQYLGESFLSYVSQSEIEEPYKNTDFDAANAFTWNYKRSATGGPISIVETDDLTNSFVVAGNKTTSFGVGLTFYVKNSLVNSGTWKTIAAVYDATDDVTRIYVEGDVLACPCGIIYSGDLPSPIDSFNTTNLNDGSESGGDWRDIYEKFYGTPYPHKEPWILQGFTSKPTWWDSEYLNDDVTLWGERTWKYKHGFDITDVSTQSFTIAGEFVEAFPSSQPGSPPAGYDVDNSTGNDGRYQLLPLSVIHTVNPGAAGLANFVIDTTGFAFVTYTAGMKIAVSKPDTFFSEITQTYIIKSTNLVGSDLTIVVEEEIVSGDIEVGVDEINGAIYDAVANETTLYVPNVPDTTVDGRVALRYGMWENIRTGRVPRGVSYPNGVISVTGNPDIDHTIYGLSTEVLPTFNYFSVNVDNVVVSTDGGTTNYASDDVLPPYWDYTEVYPTISATSIDKIVRSLFSNYSNEIVAPNANYVFNDSGPVEWEWKASSQYLYDQLAVAYRIDPAQFIYNSFGFNFTEIGGLLIDRDVHNTASHTRTNFHGDVVDNEQFISNGLNQWYVNFNRYAGYDTNFSDFQSLWTLWTAPITYQFASYVDTPSLSVAHRYIDLTDFDYNVTSKRSPGVEDFWMDAFKVQIVNIPYEINRYNNQLDWRFDIRTNISQSREIVYYDVHNYQYYPNTTTNECELYTWGIQDADAFENEFTINGDHEDIFKAGREVVVAGSSGNDGTYTIQLSSYDTITKLTTIAVDGSVDSPTGDGLITLQYRSIPWETGDPVYLSTTETMPIPLDSDTVIGTTKYFIIKTSDTTFKIANTLEDARNDNEIDITSEGFGDQYVGQLSSTFVVDIIGDVLWREYVIDKSNVLSWSTPKQIQGMQHWVDIVRGYDSYTSDNGWSINADRTVRDPDTNVITNWKVETERFIDFAYSSRKRRQKVNDKYPVTLNTSTNKFTFNTTNNVFITGDPAIVVSSTGVLPDPLVTRINYYVIRDTMESFRLAASPEDAVNGIAIDILPTSGVGDLSLSTLDNGKFLVPVFEMNPFRNAIWFNQPSGIVSNIIKGPSDDIRTTQLVFDQNGDSIQVDALRVYRTDKETKISVLDSVNNVPELTFVSSDYSNLHLGGLHIFTDLYEHVLLFNNYSAGDNLLYDPFIGLNVTKYEMLFNRNPEFTGRPNVGGYYLETFFNQGANIKENFEAGVENLRNAYDTYDTLESNLMTSFSRDAIGYEGVKDYLSNLNVSEKSQFIFWRGQIQAKGSVNAIKAYINSRRFIDAKIDEFWAIKVAEFGSVGEKEYPEMFATTVDARSNEFKVEFIDNDDDGSNVTSGFTAVKMSNTDRWYNQPVQTEVLRNNGKVMYFDMKVVDKKTGADFSLTSNNGNTYIVHGMDVDAVELTYTEADESVTQLIEGIDFVYVNPYVVKLLSAGSPYPVLTNLTVWGFVANNDAQNPSRLIDRLSETQLSTIEYWDPARGHHYSNAIHNVDLQNDSDPVLVSSTYTSTPQTTSNTYTWAKDQVGTSWMDTSTMHYIPYNSATVITDNNIRYREWGQLYDFAGINIYEWVESDVLPSEWDAIAETEAGDNNIPEDERKSGVAKFTLFEPIGSPAVWIPLKDKVDTQYAATDATVGGSFNLNFAVLDNTKTVDVYVNERRLDSVEPVGSPAVLPASVTLTVSESDVVKFVQPVPTDETVIADAIAAGTLKQEYEYTTVEEYDSFGTLSSKYYFWVGDKSTKPLDRNRVMSLQEAQQQLVTVPSAHMFFQKPLEAVTNSEDGNLVSRIEYFESATGSPLTHTYDVALPIAEGTTVTADINGLDVDSADITITGSPRTTVTLNVAVGGSPLGSEQVKISYTGVYTSDIDLPNRFTQVIVRGLQGIVFDDNRYTIRFIRDFTLRDNIDNENESLGPLDLKNLHEEWKIFRQEQESKVDRWMWDKVTEAMVGYLLDDPSIRVPSFEYELYDEKYGTDTQYGLGNNQAFVDGNLAASSILAYLVDPNISFAPIDINTFFTNYNFDTNENIIEAMNAIYDTFTVQNINRMYFSVLYDAFTTKTKYPGIFKTSMVSLHGIRPFQSSGVFDD